MVAGTLYSYPENWGWRVSTAQYCGAQVYLLSIPHFHFGQTNCTPDFLHKFPPNEAPLFEGNSRFRVLGRDSVSYCVSKENSGEVIQRQPAAHTVQRVSFAESNIVPPAT